MQRLTKTMLVALLGAASANEVSPIGKVMQLITDLQTKVISQGGAAQKAYEEYSEWCEDRARELGHEIKTGSAEVESLQASIAQSTSSAAEQTAKIEDLAGDIATDEADLRAATEIRDKERADFSAEESELVETISMLDRATGILEREMAKGSASMLQMKNAQSVATALAAMVQASMMSSADAHRLTALVQSGQTSDDADAEPGAPAAAVYESQSGNIVETLKDILEKAETQLDEARKRETANLQNFEMLKQSISDEIKFANKDMGASKNTLAQASEAKATAEGDLETASKELAEDSKAKGDLHQDCMSKAEDFEAETKSRAEELKALAEAKKVIAEATSGATDIVYSGASFFQAASHSRISSAADLKGFEAVRMVRDLARRQNSAALAQLAARMASAGHSGAADPFEKVKGLISDMIEKLESKAAADATQKSYCDKELKESTEKKAEKTSEVEKLTTRIEQRAAKSAELKDEVKELQSQLAKLMSTQAEMDKMRSTSKEVYTNEKADVELGLSGVKMALKVLSEYYAKQDKSHSAAEGAGGGIIGLLEVVESDFSKGLAEIESTEESAAATYEQETKENDIEKTMKTKDVEHKIKEHTYLDGEVKSISADRANVQAELDSVLEYLKGIEGECTEVAETYGDRTAHREAEITGLKEALATLETETALVQTRANRRFRGIARHVV